MAFARWSRAVPPTRTAAAGIGAAMVAAMIAVIGVAIVAVGPAAGHSALVGASPAPDETVGGTIDFVDLAFNEDVTGAAVTVAFNEQPLPGATTVTDGEVVRFELDQALTVPGRYQITYELVSLDTDRISSAYFFTFDPAAPQPARLGAESATLQTATGTEDESGGLNWLVIGGSALAAFVAVVALAMFVWRLDAQRDAAIDGDPDPYS